MKNNNIILNAICIVIMGLMCFGALGDVTQVTPAMHKAPVMSSAPK
jgi:hypothetical protein